MLLLPQLSQPVALSWLLQVLWKIGLRRVARMARGVAVQAGAFDWNDLAPTLAVANVVVDAAGNQARSVRQRVLHRFT